MRRRSKRVHVDRSIRHRASQRAVQGVVILEAIIDERGPGEVGQRASFDPLLDRAAEDAGPAVAIYASAAERRSGAVVMTVTVRFTLRSLTRECQVAQPLRALQNAISTRGHGGHEAIRFFSSRLNLL